MHMKDSEVILKCVLTYYGMTMGFFLGKAYQLQNHTLPHGFHVLSECRADHELKRILLKKTDDTLMSLWFPLNWELL